MKRSVNLLNSAGFLLIVLTAVCSIALPSLALQTSTAEASIADASSATKPHDAAYKIGSSDVLAITVWKEPEISRSIPVRPDGKISLPLVGELQAAGRTPLQLEQDISGKLKAYITNPDVNVMVQQINSEKFNVLGRVAHSGSFPLSSDTTVLDAIATAGGFLDFAKQKGIYILRSTPGGGQTRLAFNYKEVIKGKHPEQNTKLQPGDTVVVP
ncbi:MAG TPA: polysaccharide biosynthesis/export family protein [Bryobacteraceae bacterium]|jgi:polysaccharide export outer membrane protein|nr:polysaccharide biosynthesis/export family protein [Bryobacteraceae bacterium]